MSCRIQHLFSDTDGNFDSNPVLRGGTSKIVLPQTERPQPFINKTETGFGGSNEFLDFGLGKMLAITRVRRVADFIKMPLEFVETGLRKTNTQVDDVVRRGC